MMKMTRSAIKSRRRYWARRTTRRIMFRLACIRGNFTRIRCEIGSAIRQYRSKGELDEYCALTRRSIGYRLQPWQKEIVSNIFDRIDPEGKSVYWRERSRPIGKSKRKPS